MLRMIDHLPWPVNQGRSCLLATHWPPDIDGVATAAGWYALAKEMQPGSVVRFYCPEPLPARFLWLAKDLPIERGPGLDKYQRAFVIDCDVNSQRIRLPDEWLTGLEERGLLFSVDHHIDHTQNRADGKRHFVLDVPSVACALIDRGLFHPLFFASVWSDTRGLSIRLRDAVKYLNCMFTMGLTEEEADRQRTFMEPQRPVVLFRDLIERTKVVSIWHQDGVGTVMVVSSSRPWRHIDSLNEAREILTHYADVLLIVDKEAKRVSLWAKPSLDLQLNQFASMMIDGGGHSTMAGGSLKEHTPEGLAINFKAYLEEIARKRDDKPCGC